MGSEEEMMKVAMRAAKQNYLKEEIFEAGYDTAKFVLFVSGEQEPDIDEYDFEELQEIVSQFKTWLKSGGPTLCERLAAHFQKISQEIHETEPVVADVTPPDSPKRLIEQTQEPEEVKEPIKRTLSKDEYETMDRPADNFNEMEAKFVQTGHNVQQFGVTDETEVTLSAEEMINPGLLKPNYLLYTVETQPLGWVVQRKIDDFVILHSVLCNLYPDTVVPQHCLTKKPSTMEPQLRRRMLGRFINAIVATPWFQKSIEVFDFLRESDTKRFDAVKVAWAKSKIQRPTTLTAFMANRAELPSCPEAPCEELINSVQKFLDKAGEICGQVREKSIKVSDRLSSLSQQLASLSSLGEELAYSQKAIPEGAWLEQTYLQLSNLLKQWSDEAKSSSTNTSDVMTSFFLFMCEQIDPIQSLFRERATREAQYKKQSLDLAMKKDKLWKSRKFDQWGVKISESQMNDKDLVIQLMLPSETKYVSDLRDLNSYFNAMAFRDLKRVWESLWMHMNKSFTDFASDESRRYARLFDKWETFANS